MGFLKVIGSLVSPNAWTAQYVENFQFSVSRAEREHPEFPRCALLAIGWAEQFKLPFCPVPSCLNHRLTAKILGSFYSCLNKPYDSEALALHAVLEANSDKAFAQKDKAFDKAMRSGDMKGFKAGLDINYVIGEKFGERYKLLTRQIVEDLANNNFSALEQKFATQNPNGSRYYIDAEIEHRNFGLPVTKLPDSHDTKNLYDHFIILEDASGSGYHFGVAEKYFNNMQINIPPFPFEAQDMER
ncbi:MAG TPA: hypothetical protein VGH42_13485 [Verrucomicrobiae bacterium]|jgi:hypothetical protein